MSWRNLACKFIAFKPAGGGGNEEKLAQSLPSMLTVTGLTALMAQWLPQAEGAGDAEGGLLQVPFPVVELKSRKIHQAKWFCLLFCIVVLLVYIMR